MAKFINPSVAEIRYLRGEVITNHPVNIDLCVELIKTKEKWYPDNTGIPAILFKGCDAKWCYENIYDRDRDYQTIIDAHS